MWYYFYTGIFSTEKCVLLEANSLEFFTIIDKDNSKLITIIPFDEIAIIKLGWEQRGRNMDTIEYYCEVIDKSSKRKIKFFSWGDKYYYPKYVEFLYAVHTACKKHTHINYVCTEPPNIFGSFAKMMIVIPMIVILSILFVSIFGSYGILLLIGFCALYYFKFYEEPTESYYPEDIPEEFLPKYPK